MVFTMILTMHCYPSARDAKILEIAGKIAKNHQTTGQSHGVFLLVDILLPGGVFIYIYIYMEALKSIEVAFEEVTVFLACTSGCAGYA